MITISNIAVIGAGAIGGYAAAAARRNGHRVQLCVRSPLPGLRVDTASGRFRPKLEIVTQPELARPVDLILLTTKAHDSASASGWFRHLCGPETKVAVLQNGVDHAERVQPLVPEVPVVPALVYIAAERLSPGHILHHSGQRLVLPADPAAARVAELLDGELIQPEQVADFRTASWRKLLLNVAANPITALTGQRLGVLRKPQVRELAGGILREAVAVGRACGANLDESDVATTLETLESLGDSTGTSMLADRMAGRKIEYELITAAVVRGGAQHGLAVPLNQAILALLTGLGTNIPVHGLAAVA